MSASQYVMHQILGNIVAQYHPLADYLGYQDGEDRFLVYYQGTNGEQYMVVDTELNILGDTTIGTTRIIDRLAAGAVLLSALLGSQSDR